MTATLDRLLAYRNEEVVSRFCDTWGIARPEARRIFGDLMRYVWLSHEFRAEIAPVAIVDEMWHAFLMYTADYRAFSKRYFGKFFDHQPTTTREKKAFVRLHARSPERALQQVATLVERTTALVVEHLGDRVALRWYVTYPQRYDARFLRRAYRPPETALTFTCTQALRRRAGSER